MLCYMGYDTDSPVAQHQYREAKGIGHTDTLGKASLNDFITFGSRHVLLEAAADYQYECDSE